MKVIPCTSRILAGSVSSFRLPSGTWASRQRKSKMMLYLLDNPFSTFKDIRKNGDLPKNWKHRRKDFDELVESKCINLIKFCKRYYVMPLSDDHYWMILMLTELDNLISFIKEVPKRDSPLYEEILNLRTNAKSGFKLEQTFTGSLSSYQNFFQKYLDRPIDEILLSKLIMLLLLKLRIRAIEFKRISKDERKLLTQQQKKKTQLIEDSLFLLDIEIFLTKTYNKISSQNSAIFSKISSYLDKLYESDLNYFFDLIKPNRVPLKTKIRILEKAYDEDDKEASVEFLKIQKENPERYNRKIEKQHSRKLTEKYRQKPQETKYWDDITKKEKIEEKVSAEKSRKCPKYKKQTKNLIKSITDESGLLDIEEIRKLIKMEENRMLFEDVSAEEIGRLFVKGRFRNIINQTSDEREIRKMKDFQKRYFPTMVIS